MAKDTFYFSHDYNARSDSKIKKLLARHKFAGYGVFWAIIEDLYNNANALPTDYDSISYALRADKKLVESVINDFELFVFNDGFFGSLSVEKRLSERSDKSTKARESALKRWGKNANALPTQCDSNAIKERKGKESIQVSEKETKAIKWVVDYLNLQTGKKYSTTSKSNTTLILARLRENRTGKDFKAVIDVKCKQWKGTEMEKYLRPETLFNSTKFEGYVNESAIELPKSKPVTHLGHKAGDVISN